ncbi:Hpt domain-containing protein [Rhizorhapis sp. SPR117]|uniref:Hpt domain-containing protein n=1 Tax=Rhizorhapis sp. SPR117 TaxID=2912611 RepID=UPI001F1D6213|nr:Hpt domain-containing protein [Rhizorhapis sp. SPR117]
MAHLESTLVNWTDFAQTRRELGAGFVRILGYFREDGVKSVTAIEEAMRSRNAAALVLPAHTLKGESRQFGAERLSLIAEEIETVARRCVEYHESPEELIEQVVALRPVFEETLQLLEREANPLAHRRPTFGRKAGDPVTQGFGRL